MTPLIFMTNDRSISSRLRNKMIKSNCSWCGKQVVNASFCGQSCKNLYDNMMTKPFQFFYSYARASEYLGKDTRSIRKYEGVLFEIDKTLPTRHTKPQTCKVCGNLFKAHENRAGYCPLCSKAGEGKKSQSSKVSELYLGQGNPNFIHGGAKQTFRSHKLGKNWRKAVQERDSKCRCCQSIETLQSHHVLPAALFPNYLLDVNNGITLCGHHHVELHRARLDLLLLPTLYASLDDVLPLHDVLCLQLQFQLLRNIPAKPFSKLELLRIVPKNYHREILRLHTDFARQVLKIEI